MKAKREIRTMKKLSGFTLIELLIAVIIIGILVSIIVVVYANRASEARLAAATADLESLAQAESHAAIDTGYFYRFYALDDVVGGDNVASDISTDRIDGIRDEYLRGDAGNPTYLFIDTKTGALLPSGPAIYQRLVNSETTFNWNGPYVNYSRKTGVKIPPVTGQIHGTPLDPWGNTYFFFTIQGVVDDDNGQLVTNINVNGIGYNALIFDRPTVLSMEPDSMPGDQGTDFGEGDDLLRQF